MAHINLLPWRDAARKERQKNYVMVLAFTALMSFLVFFLINMIYNARLEGQAKRNQYLQSEISILDQRIAEISRLNETKRSLQQRLTLIEQLQSSRNLGTQVMSEIATIIPNGVYLTQLEKKGSMLLLVGKSESNNRLSNMLREAEQSELLAEPYLEFIQAAKERSSLLSDFQMHLKIVGFEALDNSNAETKNNAQGGRK
ncbi:PilN domain-containing protein [Alishewanella sp. SMS8]|uniref:PilN domain-containing protein n=1 Tax=unclassified Alishewanella TaxID=2628974 RepID=UPI002742750B|nr:PilN domain-containing protein [Alishewanella sp. SMS8]MDP4944582.1 PilN domain-containing protein [Alishewanella sp.]MDP5035233.1 PilN domain-containing protein [Alishewanella sp.]MDP5186246.1 PilN domain-containing protein [Alishewanella sp.]MDP5459520.1 PilN domain-containing protein [Alishewanella sp. SMS8]